MSTNSCTYCLLCPASVTLPLRWHATFYSNVDWKLQKRSTSPVCTVIDKRLYSMSHYFFVSSPLLEQLLQSHIWKDRLPPAIASVWDTIRFYLSKDSVCLVLIHHRLTSMAFLRCSSSYVLQYSVYIKWVQQGKNIAQRVISYLTGWNIGPFLKLSIRFILYCILENWGKPFAQGV